MKNILLISYPQFTINDMYSVKPKLGSNGETIWGKYAWDGIHFLIGQHFFGNNF